MLDIQKEDRNNDEVHHVIMKQTHAEASQRQIHMGKTYKQMTL